MPARSTAVRTGVAGLASLVVALALLWLFAPTTLGGNFAYVTVTGNSMSPLLDTGDLVLLRRDRDYEVGDAVAYRHPEIGTVLHRIVADDGRRFTTRGDNRGGDDTYQPTRDDVIGREWVILPNGGRVVSELQRPRNLALLVVATLLLAFAGGTTSRRRRGAPQPMRPAPLRGRDLSIFSPAGRQLATIAAALAAGSVALLALLAVHGTIREASEAVPFTERGAFVYGGPIEGGVYDNDQLTAPEPLYRQLVDELPLQFSYDLGAPVAGSVTDVLGTYRLTAEIGTENGWTRTYELRPATTFSAPTFEAAAALDLSAIEADLASVAELTGVESSNHIIRVVAHVEAAGRVDGLPFETAFRQFAQFRLTPLELRFDGTPDTLTVSEARSVARPITEPRVLGVPMLPVSLRYDQFPLLAALGLAIAGVLLAVVARGTLSTWRLGEAARIRAAYDALLVEVAEERASLGSARPHDVSRFEDLVRLAAVEGLAIMHRSRRDDDEYFVTTADRSWRYAARKPLPDATPAIEGRYITTGES